MAKGFEFEDAKLGFLWKMHQVRLQLILSSDLFWRPQIQPDPGLLGHRSVELSHSWRRARILLQ